MRFGIRNLMLVVVIFAVICGLFLAARNQYYAERLQVQSILAEVNGIFDVTLHSHVGVIDQGTCFRSRWDAARPASDEGNAMTAFLRTGLSSGEWAVCPVLVLLDVSLGPQSAVVAGEEHERVVCQCSTTGR